MYFTLEYTSLFHEIHLKNAETYNLRRLVFEILMLHFVYS